MINHLTTAKSRSAVLLDDTARALIEMLQRDGRKSYAAMAQVASPRPPYAPSPFSISSLYLKLHRQRYDWGTR